MQSADENKRDIKEKFVVNLMFSSWTLNEVAYSFGSSFGQMLRVRRKPDHK
jgi:hypothetical protein